MLASTWKNIERKYLKLGILTSDFNFFPIFLTSIGTGSDEFEVLKLFSFKT